MRLAPKSTLAIGAALLSMGAIANAQDHSAHDDHVEKSEQGANEEVVYQSAGAALEAYRDALVAKDLAAAGAAFADNSLIFENGKAEGSWAHYAEHHLGPELGHFQSFSFPTYEVEIEQHGHHAFGVERYTYRIELTDGRVIEREGVATSALMHGADGWKIIRYHSSSRAPRS